MAKKELKLGFKDAVQVVAEKTGLTQDQTASVIEGYIEFVKDGLFAGREVTCKGIGTFKTSTVKAREARMGKNLHTGEDMLIPAKEAHSKVAFKVSKTLQKEMEEDTLGNPYADR